MPEHSNKNEIFKKYCFRILAVLVILNLCNFYRRYRYFKETEEFEDYEELEGFLGIPLRIIDLLLNFMFSLSFVSNISAIYGFKKVLRILSRIFSRILKFCFLLQEIQRIIYFWLAVTFLITFLWMYDLVSWIRLFFTHRAHFKELKVHWIFSFLNYGMI
jgi:hypothetical protein